MEFGVKKCGILIMHRGAVAKTKTNGIVLPSGETIKHIDEDGYKYLGILEFDSVKEKEMKEAFATEYFRRVKLVCKSKLNGKNKINALNTWVISLLRYGAGILNWRVNEGDQMDRKTRKILTINKEFHPKSDIDRLYVPRKKGGRGLISCKNCIASEENNLGWYVKNKVEPLLRAVKRQGTIKTDDAIEPKEYKKREKEKVYNAWKEKRMYGQYLRDMDGKDLQNSWKWLRSSDLKECTEALICSAQEQALRTNNIKHFIDKSQDSPLCRMCDQRNETVSHIVSECTVLAQKEYLKRHNNVCQYIHWRLCKKFDLEATKNWYEHKPEGCVENEKVKLLWDFVVQCDREIIARKPDIVLVDKENKLTKIIDIAIPGEARVVEKEREKIDKYRPLRDEIARLWSMRKVEIIPVVVGALGAVSKQFEAYVEAIGIKMNVEHAQKTALLGSARILRLVLGQ
eukprot:gene16665-biopygen14077